jgi:oxygen-dependent protoporphyrinogen oxidase
MLAAYALDKKGYRVTLLEERASAGGLIQTQRTQYGIAERAAHSLLATPAVVEFCRELGVELTEIRRDSRARFILRDGRLRKFPLRLGEALSALGHAALSRAENHADATNLETWGRRHLGEGGLEYLLTPFVRGIYGVQPTELGVAAAFTELSVAPGKTLLGTLLGKAFKRPTQNGNGGRKSSDERKAAKQRKRMVAPLRGMGALTESLEHHLERRLGERFRRAVSVSDLPDAPNVVLSTPAHAAAELLEWEAPELCSRLREVRYTSLVLGGSSQPHWVASSDEAVAAAVREELAELLGIEGEPLQLVISRWPRAIRNTQSNCRRSGGAHARLGASRRAASYSGTIRDRSPCAG